MTPRTRRLLIGTAVVVALLFVGRWSSEFLVERWWAATISPAAVRAVTHWWLLGLGLDVLAISFASAWFVLQALAIGRTVKAVHITRQFGNLELREAIPTRLLLSGAVVLGVLLGWVSGAGAHTWRAPVALAWQGVVWPVEVPVLNTDLGTFVTRLPLWELTLDFLATLLILALALSVALYAVIGAIKRRERRVEINPIARGHLAVLLALTAMLMMITFLIGPSERMASAELATSMQGVLSYRFVALLMAGVACFAAVASLRWGAKGELSFLIAGWGFLIVAGFAEMLVSPSRPVTPADQLQTRQFTELAWGIVRSDELKLDDSLPPTPVLWDERLLRLAEISAGRHFMAATPSSAGYFNRDSYPLWLVASSDSARESIYLTTVADATIEAEGRPESVSALSGVIARARVRPEAPRWERVTSGVTAGNLLTKLVIAWGRQVGGVVSMPGAVNVDWHLDPVERAAALLPMADWLQPDIVLVRGRPTWLVQGLIPLTAFPIATVQLLRGREVSALLPAFLALIDVESGAIRFFRDPGESPVGDAWQQVVPGLIEPADSLPVSLLQDLPYNGGWLTIQLAALALAGMDHPNGPTAAALATPAVWQAGTVGRQYLDAQGRLGTIRRESGRPVWRIGSAELPINIRRDALEQSFSQEPLLAHLRDSIQATGDTAITAGVRWWRGTATYAWRPLVALGRERGPRIVAIATSRDGKIEVIRRPGDAWGMAGGVDQDAATLPRGESAQLREARLWLARADSALRRGDLTAFGRYFESLQRVLGKGP